MEPCKYYYDEIITPIGSLVVVGTDAKLLRIDFGAWRQLKENHYKWFHRFFNEPKFQPANGLYDHVKKQFAEYFSDERQQFSFSFELIGTTFQKRVWKALHDTTPYGQTKTYQKLAETIDHPKAVRAIGGAMNRNPLSIVIPCHRVIGKNQKLTGYGGGLDKKEFLLKHEGVSWE